VVNSNLQESEKMLFRDYIDNVLKTSKTEFIRDAGIARETFYNMYFARRMQNRATAKKIERATAGLVTYPDLLDGMK